MSRPSIHPSSAISRARFLAPWPDVSTPTTRIRPALRAPQATDAARKAASARRREFISPVRRRLAVDEDAVGLHGDVAALHEVLEDAAHHLAGAPHAARDLRLRELLGHELPALLRDRLVEQEARDPPVRIHERE